MKKVLRERLKLYKLPSTRDNRNIFTNAFTNAFLNIRNTRTTS